MKKLLTVVAVLVSIGLLFVGCSNPAASNVGGNISGGIGTGGGGSDNNGGLSDNSGKAEFTYNSQKDGDTEYVNKSGESVKPDGSDENGYYVLLPSDPVLDLDSLPEGAYQVGDKWYVDTPTGNLKYGSLPLVASSKFPSTFVLNDPNSPIYFSIDGQNVIDARISKNGNDITFKFLAPYDCGSYTIVNASIYNVSGKYLVPLTPVSDLVYKIGKQLNKGDTYTFNFDIKALEGQETIPVEVVPGYKDGDPVKEYLQVKDTEPVEVLHQVIPLNLNGIDGSAAFDLDNGVLTITLVNVLVQLSYAIGDDENFTDVVDNKIVIDNYISGTDLSITFRYTLPEV